MNTITLITRTAILLALTILFQSLRLLIPVPPNISQYLIGSLVNLTLVIAAVIVGYKGGMAIAILAPIVALLQGFTPFPILTPIVALGNIVLVVIVAFLYIRNKYLSIVLGTVAKFIVLYIGIVKIAVPFLITNAKPPQLHMLSISFSWPQLVTATIGGVIALAVIPLIERGL